MGKMQEEIKALRRQNRHLENIVQRQRQHIEDAESVIEAFKRGLDAHYAACAVQFGEKREDCDTLWGYHLEIPAKLADKKVAAIHIADDGKIEQLAGKVLTIGGKKYYEFTTPHFSTFALVDADELGLEVEEPQVDAKALTAKLTPVTTAPC